jgi:hypothetical protein
MTRIPRRPRPGWPRRAVRLLAVSCGAAAAIALAGCGTGSAPGPASLDGTTTSTPATPAASPEPTQATPAQRAKANAALLLKAFAPPPGARQVPVSPVPSSSLARYPQATGPMDDDVVRATSWWLAPGDPQRVLAWEAAHLTAYPKYGYGTSGKGIYVNEFRVPAVAGLFDTRDLAVSTTSAGHGEVAIRVDSLVDWIPVRPSGDTVPATARVATAVETRDVPGATSDGTVKTAVVAKATVTSPAQAGAIAAYLNRLTVSPPGGQSSCPDQSLAGGTLTVTFRATAGGPALAEASAGLSGCAFLSYATTGLAQLGLGGGDAGTSLLAEFNHVTGLHWKVP